MLIKGRVKNSSRETEGLSGMVSKIFKRKENRSNMFEKNKKRKPYIYVEGIIKGKTKVDDKNLSKRKLYKTREITEKGEKDKPHENKVNGFKKRKVPTHVRKKGKFKWRKYNRLTNKKNKQY